MRTVGTVALVASLLILTGCTTIKGPGGRGGGFCDDGGCDSPGAETVAHGFRGGPFSGVVLNDVQTTEGCGCDSCEVGQAYVGGQVRNWLDARGEGGLLNGGQFAERVASAAAARPLAGTLQNAGARVASFASTHRGLGRAGGCTSCQSFGGPRTAVGTNNTQCANGECLSGGGCGPDGCGVIGGGRLADRGPVRRALFRGTGSPHPYGGELPHTGAPAFGNGAAAPAFAYPYYTTRGPRDFLQANPPSIGR